MTACKNELTNNSTYEPDESLSDSMTRPQLNINIIILKSHEAEL